MNIVMGNGESRKAVSYDLLKPHKTYGCNALHRDFSPSALIVIDDGMYFEVIESGYPKNNQCYFSNYDGHLPPELYPMMVSSLSENVEILENEKTDFGFVWYGRELKRKWIEEKKIFETVNEPCYICGWIEEDYKITNIDDIIGNILQDAGQQALNLMCEIEKPKTVYLLGFDLSNNNGKHNNVYKDTNNYGPSIAGAVNATKWINDLNVIFDKYSNTEFIHIQDSKVLDIETISVQNFINILKES